MPHPGSRLGRRRRAGPLASGGVTSKRPRAGNEVQGAAGTATVFRNCEAGPCVEAEPCTAGGGATGPPSPTSGVADGEGGMDHRVGGLWVGQL